MENEDKVDIIRLKNAFINKYPELEDCILYLDDVDQILDFYDLLERNSNNKGILTRIQYLDDYEFEEFISKISSYKDLDVLALLKQYSTETNYTKYFMDKILEMHKNPTTKDGFSDVLNNNNSFLTQLKVYAELISSLENKLSYCDTTYGDFIKNDGEILPLDFYFEMNDDYDSCLLNRREPPNLYAWLRAQSEEYKESVFNEFKDYINDISEIKDLIGAISQRLQNKTDEHEDTITHVANANNIKDLQNHSSQIRDLVEDYFKQSILSLNNKKQLNNIKNQLDDLVHKNHFTGCYVKVGDFFYTKNNSTPQKCFTNLSEKCIEEIDKHPVNQSFFTKLKNTFNKDTGRL